VIAQNLVGFFFSTEISEISPVTVILATLRKSEIPSKKNRLRLNLDSRQRSSKLPIIHMTDGVERSAHYIEFC
jgi:hypothetical protein